MPIQTNSTFTISVKSGESNIIAKIKCGNYFEAFLFYCVCFCKTFVCNNVPYQAYDFEFNFYWKEDFFSVYQWLVKDAEIIQKNIKGE